MTALGWVLAAVAGVVVWTVAVAAPLGVLIGRAVARRDAVEAAKDRHPAGKERHLREVKAS